MPSDTRRVQIEGFPLNIAKHDLDLALRQITPSHSVVSIRPRGDGTSIIAVELPAREAERLLQHRHLDFNNLIKLKFTTGNEPAAATTTGEQPPSPVSEAPPAPRGIADKASVDTLPPPPPPPPQQPSGALSGGARPVCSPSLSEEGSRDGPRLSTWAVQRRWINLASNMPSPPTPPCSFTVVSWNIMRTDRTRIHHSSCPPECLAWSHRAPLVTALLDTVPADVVLLQDVSAEQRDTLQRHFEKRDFAIWWAPQRHVDDDDPSDGVLMAVSKKVWRVPTDAPTICHLTAKTKTARVALALTATHRDTGALVTFATTNLLKGPCFERTRQLQVAELCARLSGSVVLGGTFNSPPRWGLVEYMNGEKFREPYQDQPRDTFAASAVTCLGPEAQPGWLDYLYYRHDDRHAASIVPAALLQVPSECDIAIESQAEISAWRKSKSYGPADEAVVDQLSVVSPSFPSDHIPLVTRFTVATSPTTSSSSPHANIERSPHRHPAASRPVLNPEAPSPSRDHGSVAFSPPPSRAEISPELHPYSTFFINPAAQHPLAPYTLNEILLFTDVQLEERHNFVQWLFPNRRPSSYAAAPPLTDADLSLMRSSPRIMDNFNQGVRHMLQFWGIACQVPSEEPIAATRGFLIRDAWQFRRYLELQTDNHLRMTRLLKALDCLNCTDIVRQLVLCLETAARRSSVSLDFFKAFHNYWKLVVSPPAALPASEPHVARRPVLDCSQWNFDASSTAPQASFRDAECGSPEMDELMGLAIADEANAKLNKTGHFLSGPL